MDRLCEPRDCGCVEETQELGLSLGTAEWEEHEEHEEHEGHL